MHRSFDDVRSELSGRWFGFSSAGTIRYDAISYEADDVLVFGAERGGLPGNVVSSLGPDRLALLPMVEGNRSLNLANAVAVVVYEGWRQSGFDGAGNTGATTSETPGATPFDR